jgi:hypothetical protein
MMNESEERVGAWPVSQNRATDYGLDLFTNRSEYFGGLRAPVLRPKAQQSPPC